MGKGLTRELLRESLKYLIEVHRIPFRMTQCFYVEKIPSMKNGKTDYQKLLQWVREGKREGRHNR